MNTTEQDFAPYIEAAQEAADILVRLPKFVAVFGDTATVRFTQAGQMGPELCDAFPSRNSMAEVEAEQSRITIVAGGWAGNQGSTDCLAVFVERDEKTQEMEAVIWTLDGTKVGGKKCMTPTELWGFVVSHVTKTILAEPPEPVVTGMRLG